MHQQNQIDISKSITYLCIKKNFSKELGMIFQAIFIIVQAVLLSHQKIVTNPISDMICVVSS